MSKKILTLCNRNLSDFHYKQSQRYHKAQLHTRIMTERTALLCLAITSLSCQVSSFLSTPAAITRPFSRGATFASAPPSPPAAPRVVGSNPRRATTTRLWGINLDSNDAFEILDLKPTPDLDKKQIKRAYRRLALKYHPDVVTNQSSTKEEKKKAGDVFAKINWAYETLSGKNGAASQPATGASSSAGSSTAGAGYQPPHRRTGSYANPNASTDWKDYMPKYDDKDYDAGGDSFGSIFSDLFTSAAVGAASGGGGGIFKDFVDFLESNVDGYSGDSSSDSELYTLLATGNLEDVGNEVDDTELVVTQLSAKMKNINDELLNVKADLNLATKYMEKLDLEERVAELEARKKVVQGYVKKARKRLLSLQTRYKELIVGGSNDRRAGGRSSRSSSSSSSGPSSSYSAAGYRSNASERASTSTGTSSTSSSSKVGSEDEDAWKRQGFGSSGRRGSGRRRRGSTEDEPAPPQQPRQQAEPAPPRPEPTYQRTPAQRSPAPSSSSSSSVPPHRRTSEFRRDSEDKKRMQEIKVDEEFEKLKKELGL
jgi:hypothetical protein